MSKKSRRVCIALITDDHENVLMGKRNDNDRWANPGGHAHPKEDPHHSIVRELKEETGLDAQDVKLVGSNWDKERNLIIYLFKVTVDPKQMIDTSQDPDKEFDDLHYMNPNDIAEELHVPIERNIALQYWIKS